MDIEKQLEENRKEQAAHIAMVAERGRLKALYENEDFKALIMDSLLEKEAVRCVHLRGDSGVMGTPGVVERVDAMITTIGTLKDWFHSIDMMGKQAASDLAQAKQTEEELLREQSGAEVIN
jgi:hypothetical protein